MNPAECRGWGSRCQSSVVLPVVLKAPCRFEDSRVVGGDHSSFAARGHDLVLAERKRGSIAKGTHLTAFVGRSMSLRAILNYLKTTIACEAQDGIHVARPSIEMDSDDCSRTRRKHRFNCCGCQILA